MSTLPVAARATVRRYALGLVLRHPRRLLAALALHASAAVSGLVPPWLLGRLMQDVQAGTGGITHAVLQICAFIAGQAVLVMGATYVSASLGEKVLAEVREEFVAGVLSLPLTAVERGGAGDLISRTTRDVDELSATVRLGVPNALISLTFILFGIGALIVVDPLLALPCLVGVPLLWAASRWYLARARAAYLREGEAYARMTEGLLETADGARTVEALGIGARRIDRADRDIAESRAAERSTLRLLSVYLPIVDTTYMVPVAATLFIGGMFYINGLASLAAVTVAVLYTSQLIAPADLLLSQMEEFQRGGASLSRLIGIWESGPGRATAGEDPGTPRPAERGLVVRSAEFAYRPDRPVLAGIDLEIDPGERLAIVGPSGAGKTTLGRVLAGIETPVRGTVEVDGVPLSRLSPDVLRKQIALVTQEHHVFAGTLRDNVVLARPGASDQEVREALVAVEAWGWAASLGLDAPVAEARTGITPAQAQQLSLARVMLADPRVVVLDEATSLIDPGAARRLERTLSAVLEGRTVIMIAHRLHTAHDADRIAVLDKGRIVELGAHDELVRNNGPYAALWGAWHGRRATSPSATSLGGAPTAAGTGPEAGTDPSPGRP